MKDFKLTLNNDFNNGTTPEDCITSRPLEIMDQIMLHKCIRKLDRARCPVDLDATIPCQEKPIISN